MTESSTPPGACRFQLPRPRSQRGHRDSHLPRLHRQPPERPAVGRASGPAGLRRVRAAAAGARHGLARAGPPRLAGLVPRLRSRLSGPRRQDRHCYVAGLSMGGAIALLTAARHPVAGVAVVNPGLSFYDRRVRVHRPAQVLPAHHASRSRRTSPTAAATEDGDYSLTPLAAVHQLNRLFGAAHARTARRHRAGTGIQVRNGHRGSAVVAGAAAEAAWVAGAWMWSDLHGQRPCGHPGRRRPEIFEQSVAVLPAARSRRARTRRARNHDSETP